jgi:4-hydroxybenzoate polyprenyltransferase
MSDHKEKRSLGGLVKFFRIKDALKWTLISFIGFILGITSLSIETYYLPFFSFLVATFCIMSFTFAINNYYDVESDRTNPRRKNINVIASGYISRNISISLLLILILVPIIISIFLGLEILSFCIFLLFIGWAYSAPPLRTKNIPVLDVAWHFLGFFSYIVWGSLIAGSIGMMTWLMAISIGIFSSIGQVGNHINDYSYDKKSGTSTFAVWAGLDKAKITINVLTLLHLILIIPLVLFYSIQYYASIGFLIIVALLGLIVLRPRGGMFPTRRCWTFYFAVIIGGGVYISVLIYHIYTLLGVPPLELLSLFGI